MASAFPDAGKMVANPEYEIVNQMKKPLAYLVSPFGGGGQVKKTIEGLTAWHRGYVSSPSGKTDLYGVNKDFFNFMRGALFGKSSFPEAVEHWNKPKSEED